MKFRNHTELLTASSNTLPININKIVRTTTVSTLLMQDTVKVRRETEAGFHDVYKKFQERGVLSVMPVSVHQQRRLLIKLPIITL
jgi:hypothetical protein